jgi:hydrogenase maturation protein HypF
LLRSGQIVAVKGVGGYHLACDARNAATVEALRNRKYRKEKPFALMVRDLAEAHEMAELTPVHEQLLLDVARPVVLAPAQAQLAGVAPDCNTLGIMLPYAPLHHLLFAAGAPSPLVLTSANRSSEPIAYRDDDARRRLKGIADAFLVGQRPIARRVDDSVVTVRRGTPFMIRRSRGFAPAAVAHLPTDVPLLAVGADLKNSVALVVRGEVFVSQYIGDLGELETDTAFEETVRDLLGMYEIDPRQLVVAHDLHPEFKSTRFAASIPARRRVAVQHHEAHIASVMAEHELLQEPVVGVAFDGTGYGRDGSIWGGEFFVGSVAEGFQRSASLRPVRLPGGDAAARFPVQAAAGFLADLGDLPDMSKLPFSFPPRFERARELVSKNVRSFVSTSIGRLFDAVAALLGFTRESTYEGQAAIWLEHQARGVSPQPAYEFERLDPRELLRSILHDRLAGRAPAEMAAAFHAALAAAVVEQVRALCIHNRISTVALSGGVFQNDLLLDSIVSSLAEQDHSLRVIFNRNVPANDGGIALGQAALASMALTENKGVP